MRIKRCSAKTKRILWISLAAALAFLLAFFSEKAGLRASLHLGRADFSWYAVAIKALVLFSFGAIAVLPDLRKPFSPKCKPQTAVFALAVIACLLFCFLPQTHIDKPADTPIPRELLRFKDIHIQQFDAFQKGMLHLDLDVSPGLEALENPYDPEERHAADVSYRWDHAYYNGHYYSYFGLTPILTVYYPYFLITEQLPSLVQTSMILAFGAVLFAAMAWRELLIFFKAKTPFWLSLAGLFAVVFGCGIFPGLSYSDIYFIPALSAVWFGFATVFFVLRAHRTSKTASGSVLYALAGLCLVLTVQSRPTAALAALILLPAICKRVFAKGIPLRRRLWLIAPAFTVVCAGAAFTMWYNYARFGAVLDFGANYQLTVSDVSKNTVSLSLLPHSIYHYFLLGFNVKEEFPWITTLFIAPQCGERYVYCESSVGLLWFPAISGFAVAFCNERLRKMGIAQFVTVILAAISIVGVSFLDFCKAGVNMRYLLDLLPTAISVGAVLLCCSAAIGEKEGAGGTEPVFSVRKSVFAALCFAATVYVSVALVFANGGDVLFH